jgi:hypothetical protein
MAVDTPDDTDASVSQESLTAAPPKE